MRQILFTAILVLGLLGVFGNVEAKDANGQYIAWGPVACSMYIDAYSQTTLTRSRNWEGPMVTGQIFGWINGYISAYNIFVQNGKQDSLPYMTYNDARRWIVSWCQDNPSEQLSDAISSLIRSRK